PSMQVSRSSPQLSRGLAASSLRASSGGCDRERPRRRAARRRKHLRASLLRRRARRSDDVRSPALQWRREHRWSVLLPRGAPVARRVRTIRFRRDRSRDDLVRLWAARGARHCSCRPRPRPMIATLVPLEAPLLVLAALAATGVAFALSPLRQIIVNGLYGLLLVILFVVFQAPDVALSMLVVTTVAYPLIVLVAIRRTRK